jgi:pimeloyl-ACP methyl ester carboxylesterase
VEETTTYEIPIAFIHGELDRQVPYSLVTEYTKRLNAPKAEVFLMENAGHLLHVDDLETCQGILKKLM